LAQWLDEDGSGSVEIDELQVAAVALLSDSL
jgi:hypothetical protein